MPDYQNYFDNLLSGIGKSSADLIEGCPECDGPENWPTDRAIVYAYLSIFVYGLANITGRVPAITSGYRCAPCNVRRGGAARSRHLAGESGGAPYGALDIQWPVGYLENVIPYLEFLPDYLRAYAGLSGVGVGVIAYAGRRRLHVDLRERDYIEDQT